MSRPTRPPGPPYPDEPYPEEPYQDEPNPAGPYQGEPYQDEPYPAEQYPDERYQGEPYQENRLRPPAPPSPAQPRFTPKHGSQQQPPPVPPPPPSPHGGPAAPSFSPTPPPHQQMAPPAPHQPPPPPPPSRATQPPPPEAGPGQPVFTPNSGGGKPGHGRHGGRPRPSFTPREGYSTPEDQWRTAAPPPTAFFSPAPAGYQPVPVPQEYGYAGPAPRFTPVDRQADQELEPEQDNRTRVLERPGEGARSTGPERRADSTSPNLARSSRAMAFGTIASRGTGFLRTFVLVAVLGGGALADAYNNSNTLPNTVYYLMLGGIFTAVVVPLLVRAAKEDPDRGEAYAERIYTFGVISLLVVTVLGTALAGPLVDLYAGNINGPPGSAAAAEHHLMVIFAYFFIPQIFFYGMDSLLGAILNTRGRFGANMWTPVINNVVVIIVGALFFFTEGLNRTPQNISPGGIDLLAIGTTLGIVIQSICLFPVLRRAGFSMRLRWDLRRSEISEIGRLGGWMFGYVVTQWLGNLVVQRVANAAASSAASAAELAAKKAAAAKALAEHVPLSHVHVTASIPDVGYSVYSYAWQLFQLPYAIVGISVISALLPRMSGHANERRYSLVRDDFSKGVRIASVIVVPAAIILAVLGPSLCQILFAYGSFSARSAQYTGEVFGVFALGLVPFMLTQLQLRVFYSFRENRTPAVIGMVMLIVGVIGALIALKALPATRTVLGLAFAYDLVSLTGAVIAWPLLLRRVGSLDGWRITRSLVRMFIATLPGLVFAIVVIVIVSSVLHPGPLYGFVVTVVGGGGAVVLYAVCCRMLGIEEFRTLMRSVGGRFG